MSRWIECEVVFCTPLPTEEHAGLLDGLLKSLDEDAPKVTRDGVKGSWRSPLVEPELAFELLHHYGLPCRWRTRVDDGWRSMWGEWRASNGGLAQHMALPYARQAIVDAYVYAVRNDIVSLPEEATKSETLLRRSIVRSIIEARARQQTSGLGEEELARAIEVAARVGLEAVAEGAPRLPVPGFWKSDDGSPRLYWGSRDVVDGSFLSAAVRPSGEKSWIYGEVRRAGRTMEVLKAGIGADLDTEGIGRWLAAHLPEDAKVTATSGNEGPCTG